MIRKELRVRGWFMRFLSNFKDEKSFVAVQKVVRWFVSGRKPKDLLMKEVFIRTPENGNLRLCVYKAKKNTQDAVGLLWLHGGGYAIGAPEQDIGFIRQFLSAANCVVVAPDYTLSIDAPYPAALLDCYAALLWMRDRASALGIRGDQLFVGGESAGGGLTAAVSLLAREKGEVNIAFQMPLYPMIDDRMVTPSSRGNAMPVWNSHSNEIAWRKYLGNLYGTADVPAFAAPARTTDYRGLPATYTYVGSLEPFCDETAAYVAALREAGVEAEIHVYEGCYHAFDVVARKSQISQEARKVLLSRFAHAAAHCHREQPRGKGA